MSERLRTLPRWIIFLLDLSCVAAAILVSCFIRYDFHISPFFEDNFKSLLFLTLSVNALLFLVFRTYAGIIRYTTVYDTFRLLMVTTLSSLVYIAVSVAYYEEGSKIIIPRTAILINFFIVNAALIGYRVLVRHFYRVFFREHVLKNRTKAVVYDTGEHGRLAKRVISDYPQSQMQIVAFLDDKSHKHGKLMEGVPIYDLHDATFKKLAQDKVSVIIISNNKEVAVDKLNFIVDKALQYGIRVQQIPPITQWLKGGKPESPRLKDINIEDLLEREEIKIYNENIFHELKGKKILVTGAAGSIGSELVRQLLRLKPSLIIMCDKAETPMHELTLELAEKFPNAPVKPYIGDICDKVRMEHLFEIYNPEIVFHAAAYKHVPLMEENPSVAVVNNVWGTRIIAELAVNFGVEKFVMVSTDKAVNPTNVMGASKRICEIFIQSLSRQLHTTEQSVRPTRFVTTRFGNVLGSNGSVIPRFRKQIEKGGPITVTHPDITRYFMTIPEACQLVIEAGVMGNGGEIFVFDMGEPVKIADLAEKMIRLSGRHPGSDIEIVFTGLRPGEKLYEELLSSKENTLPTYHEKILIAQVREYDFSTVDKKINKLVESASKHFTYETVALMKDLVPEFISNNSTFEDLDIKLAQH